MPNLNNWMHWILESSSLFAFVSLSIWTLLRMVEKIADWAAPAGPKFFPLSAQKKGFAQAIGTWSVIVSEQDYKRRAGKMGFFKKLARIWWPMVAYFAFAIFLLAYGAKGISEQMDVSFWTGLALIGSVLGLLGVFSKKRFYDHFKGSYIPEGAELDWDAQAYVGGLRVRARFEGKPRKSVLIRKEDQAVSKDGAEPFYWHGMMAQPDSVHWHGNGMLVSEFRMLDGPDEKIDEENWLKKMRLKDVLHATISAYVLAGSQKACVCALLEYPGVVLLINPLEEHLKFLDAVASRLKKRREVPAIPAREVAAAASQEFYSKFDEKRVGELLSHLEWVSKEDMPI